MSGISDLRPYNIFMWFQNVKIYKIYSSDEKDVITPRKINQYIAKEILIDSIVYCFCFFYIEHPIFNFWPESESY